MKKLTCINSVCVLPKTITVNKGSWYDSLRAEACLMNSYCKCVKWYSENPQIAAVNPCSGSIMGMSVGTTRIFAKYCEGGGCIGSVTVKVNTPVSNIIINKTHLLLEKGSSYALSADVYPKDATNKSIKWFSSDDKIVSVNSEGLITAINHGTAMITAVAEDGSRTSATSKITVQYSVFEKYQTKNRCFATGKSIGAVKGIVVHSTGSNNKYLKRYVYAPNIVGVNKYGNHWNNSSAKKMVHAFIGLDINGEPAIVNTLPYNFACWGVGAGKKGSYNYSPRGHIQFEICEDALYDESYYREIVWKVAVQYCAYLCRRFGLSVNTIVSHKEAHLLGYGSNHGDIDHWLRLYGDSMNDFRAAVQKKIDEYYA